MPALHWKVNWPTTLLTLLMLPLVLGLGRWQLHRAEEKRIAQAAFEVAQTAAPLDIAQLPATAEQYARVRLKGHYDNAHNFLLDNRISHGRFGYEILTPFLSASTPMMVLVNRGWIEGDPARRRRPTIAPVEGEVELVGAVYRDTSKFHFVDNAHEAQWPKLIQNLQIDDVQKQLAAPLLPFVVRLDAGMPGAYVAEWQVFPTGFGPERHIAYAVTWFTLAVVLTITWLVSNSNIAQLFTRSSHGE